MKPSRAIEVRTDRAASVLLWTLVAILGWIALGPLAGAQVRTPDTGWPGMPGVMVGPVCQPEDYPGHAYYGPDLLVLPALPAPLLADTLVGVELVGVELTRSTEAWVENLSDGYLILDGICCRVLDTRAYLHNLWPLPGWSGGEPWIPVDSYSVGGGLGILEAYDGRNEGEASYIAKPAGPSSVHIGATWAVLVGDLLLPLNNGYDAAPWLAAPALRLECATSWYTQDHGGTHLDLPIYYEDRAGAGLSLDAVRYWLDADGYGPLLPYSVLLPL